MEAIKKLWLFLLSAIAFILSQLPDWLPEDSRYQAFNKVVNALRALANYQAPVLITVAVLLLIFGVGYIFNRKQEDQPIEKKYPVRNTMCRVHAKSKAAFHNPNLITTLVRCVKDGARFEHHSGRDHAGYSCTVCGLQLSDDEYNRCKNEAESLFVREHDPLNKSVR